jgi:YVTN family beta-propeller protein
VKGIVIAAVLAASVAAGQYLEATIPIDDTLSTEMLFSVLTVGGKVYVGGYGDAVLVTDAIYGHRIARVPVYGNVYGLCANPQGTKVYATSYERRYVAVIDVRGDSLLTEIPVGGMAYAMAYDEPTDKLYCVSMGGQPVAVIDAVADTLLCNLTAGPIPSDVCINQTDRKVYVVNSSGRSVTVIDADADTVLTTVDVGYSPIEAIWNPVVNKVYVANYLSGQVTVIDGAADTVLTVIDAVYGVAALCCNIAENKVYCAEEDGYDLLVIDGFADTVLSHLTGVGAWDMSWLPSENKLFCSGGSRIHILDAHADTILAQLYVDGSMRQLDCDTSTGRIFAVSEVRDRLGVADGLGDSLIAVRVLGDEPVDVCFNPFERELYCVNQDGDELVVVSGATNSITRRIGVGCNPVACLHVPNGDKLYVASEGRSGVGGPNISVLNTFRYQVNGVIPLSHSCNSMWYNPFNEKVYCPGSGYYDSLVTVIDAFADTVTKVLAAGRRPAAFAACPVENKVYCANREDSTVTVIGAAADTVLAVVVVGRSPAALVYDRRDNEMYCALSDEDSIVVFDCGTDQVTGRIHIGREQWLGCYSSFSERMYFVSDYYSYDRIAVVDPVRDTVESLILVRHGVDELVCDTVGGKLYLMNGDRNEVTAIDCQANEVMGVVEVGDEPVAMAWDPHMRRVYTADREALTVSVIRDSVILGLHAGTTADEVEVPAPTVVRGVLRIRPTADGSQLTAALVDISGRKVMDLEPGENDVRSVAPGVYFVSERSAASGKRSTVTKVIINR